LATLKIVQEPGMEGLRRTSRDPSGLGLVRKKTENPTIATAPKLKASEWARERGSKSKTSLRQQTGYPLPGFFDISAA
jgi:hypothetical protein